MTNDQPRVSDRPVMPSLSLVVPAYNEADRIAETVATALAYLAAQPYSGELIVVDDGSADATAEISERLAVANPALHVIKIPHGGKATALRAGMAAASGDLVAFSDADLATPLAFLDDLREAIADGADLAIGSREGIGARRLGEPHYRHLMGRVFNGFVRLLVLPGIQDTQCGFKLFRREVAVDILRRARLYATPAAALAGPRVTAFDVELLFLARRLGYRLAVVPVVWTYGEQSKVQPARDAWNNFMDVLRVRLNAWRGKYESRE